MVAPSIASKDPDGLSCEGGAPTRPATDFTFLQKIGAKIGAAIYTAKRFVKNKSTNLKTKRVTTGKKGKKRKNNKEKKGHREGQNPNTSGTTKQADPAAAAGKNEIKMETQQHPNLPKAQGGDMAL